MALKIFIYLSLNKGCVGIEIFLATLKWDFYGYWEFHLNVIEQRLCRNWDFSAKLEWYFYGYWKFHLNFAEKRLRRSRDSLAILKRDFYGYWKSHFKFRPKKVTSEIARLLLQCTLSEPTQCGERERERARGRERGTETVNAHMYLRTLCLKCELCQLPS